MKNNFLFGLNLPRFCQQIHSGKIQIVDDHQFFNFLPRLDIAELQDSDSINLGLNCILRPKRGALGFEPASSTCFLGVPWSELDESSSSRFSRCFKGKTNFLVSLIIGETVEAAELVSHSIFLASWSLSRFWGGCFSLANLAGSGAELGASVALSSDMSWSLAFGDGVKKSRDWN